MGGRAQAGAPIAVMKVSETPPPSPGADQGKPALESVAGQESQPATRPPNVFPLPLEPIVKGPWPKQIVQDLAKTGPVVPPPQQEDMIDLSTALRLAEVENPTIAIGRQAIQEALARQLQARAMALPHLRAGLNYHLHNGVLQNSFGLLRRVNSESLYFGAGSRALAAETVAFPGVQFVNHLGDMFFEPLAARQLVSSKQAHAAAIANIVLLDVALRFLDLMSAEGELAAFKQSEMEMNLIVQTTAAFAKAGQGRDANAKRARTEALLLHIREQAAEEHVAAAAAELARVLNLDPAVRLRTPAKDIALLQLVEADFKIETLLQFALNSRPELAALRAEIARKETQVRQEQLRPLFPTVSIGYSAGGFGGGTNRADLVPVHPEFGRIGSRSDFDVIAYWTLQNMGAGNRAAANKRQAERGIAVIEQVGMVNQIRREVASALAQTEASRRHVGIAQQRLDVAEKGFREDYTRIRGNIGLPIEVINSMDRLVQARHDFIQALAGYNKAQFQLFFALGQNAGAARLE